MRTIIGWLVLIWLVIGAYAGFQRDYYSTADANCASVSTIALTVVAGPLNYFGANPKVDDCRRPPRPSR